MSTTTTRPPETPSAAPARSRRAAAAASVRRALPAAGILVAIALIWEAVSHWIGVPDYVLPSLDRIWRTGVSSWSGTLASATWVTTKEVLLGFLLAVVVALALAFALHSSRTVRNAVYPLLIGSRAVPIVVIAPVLAIIFGYTITPKRIVATYAPIGAVFGEYAGSQNGLGYVMIQAIPQLETDLVFAAIFILTFEAILLFIAVSVLERITCPWAREGKR